MTNQYTYTPAGLAASKTLSLASNNHSSNGNPASGSVTVNYTYDNQGVLTQIAPQGSPTLTYTLEAAYRAD
jgi:hypothetical protein